MARALFISSLVHAMHHPTAFLPTSPLPLHRRPRPLPHPLQPRCALPAPRKATLFTNGKRIYVRPSTSAQPLETLYIVCPHCATAYVGNAVTRQMEVKCAKCATNFSVSPTQLYAISTHKSTLANHASPSSQLVSDRIVCAHFDVCPGCTVDTLAAEPPILADVRRFVAALGLAQGLTSVKCDTAHSWRTHAKLAVRSHGASVQTPQLGLFRMRSHELVPIPKCTVHAAEINLAAAAVEESLKSCGALPYNDVTGKGHCRYVLFTVHRASRKVQVTLVWNASSWKDSTPMSQRVAGQLWRAYPKLVHSVWFNWNTSMGNAIVTPGVDRFYHMHGWKQLVENVRGVDIHFPPYAFRQANLDAFEKLVLPDILRYIPTGSAVAEFCAGVGVIGLVALKEKRLASLIASEINEGAEDAFWNTFKGIRKSMSTGDVQFVVGSDADTLHIMENANIVIVDPPRAGLSAELVQTLADSEQCSALKRIIYVSCGFKAFQNDAKLLCASAWQLKAAHAVVLFPGSDHVELVVVLDRKHNQRRNVARGRIP